MIEGSFVSTQAEVAEGKQVCSVAVARFVCVQAGGVEQRILEHAVIEVVVDEMSQLGIHARRRRHGSLYAVAPGASGRVRKRVLLL